MKRLYSFHVGIIIIFLQFIISLLSVSYVTGQSVTSFTLVNADTKKDISQLTDGQVLILSALPTVNLNIRANTDRATTGSVNFSYDTVSNFHIENVAPYFLAGDNHGNPNTWTPAAGRHTIIATAYSDSNATGTIGTSLTTNFTVFKDSVQTSAGTAQISGELKKWHRVTLTFDGPNTSETGNPNPFLDYRLDVTFTNSLGESFKVPGYFAADGNAGETGAVSGNKWRVHFAPDETGTWTYLASFKQGTNIAADDSVNAGTAVYPADGATDTFSISPSDKTGIDLRAKGLLKFVGEPLMQFAETGEYFRKAGTDAPENFLAYDDFDNTPDSGSRRKSWAPHIQDWKTGDPEWHNGKGKGIIGAVNYLSGAGMNSFSFLTMNINGDDKNVYPYLSPASLTRIDVSKVAQWEIVFEHAQKMGMHLHFKMQEIESNNILDGGNLGIERKLYCRELIARFSHHLALNWNVGEENSQTTQQQKDMAKYLYDHDPYKHNIVLHTLPGKQEEVYRPLLGNASSFTGLSIQTDTSNVYPETRKWVEASANAGKKWIVANDEQNPASTGVAADSEYTGNRGSIADNSEQIRKDVLWGNLMAGGAGVEYYFGYKTGETDLSCQDFRSRAKSFRYAKNALDFFRTYLPFTTLIPMDNVSAGWSLGKDSEAYVIYLKGGGSSMINLPFGNYIVKWYNPRTGGSLQNGSITKLSSGTASIGFPPSDSSSDWTILIQTTKPSDIPPTVTLSSPANNSTYITPATIAIKARASDSDGSIRKVEFYNDSIKLGEDTTSPYSYTWRDVSEGAYSITAKAFDNAGKSTVSAPVNITVTKSPPSAGSIVFAVNAGGPAYTASNGITYQADTDFIGGNIYKTTDTISGTADDSLYKSERFGNFSYAIPVSNGTYEITFRFAEIFQEASDKREFHVLAEDSEVISKLDIYSAAGRDKAYDVVKTVTVKDGDLDIQFRSDIDNAKLSALHVKVLNTAVPISRAIQNLPIKERIINNISVFPNPTTGMIYFLSKQQGQRVIKMYDNEGRNLFTNNYAKKTEQIDLSGLSPGLYHIQSLLNGTRSAAKTY